MRIIATLFFLLLSSAGFSQIYDMIRAADYQNNKYLSTENTVQLCGMFRGISDVRRDLATIQADAIKKDTSQLRIFIRCAASQNNSESPLLVIDGIPYPDRKMLSDIKPGDIESINILKKADVLNNSGIIFCRSPRNVILITTKYADSQKIVIKDFLNGEGVAGATVSFISADNKETIMAQANDSGIVITDKLKNSLSYSINVSSVGYKNLVQSYKKTYQNKEQEILLERDLKICNEVIVTIGPGFGCGRRYRVTEVSSSPLQNVYDSTGSLAETFPGNVSIPAKIFPNPLPKGNTLTIETTTVTEQPMVIKITGLNGKTLLSQSQKAIKGLNRFSISTDNRWASGIYLVNLYANGSLLASDKIILQ